jgi:hypothetical protein
MDVSRLRRPQGWDPVVGVFYRLGNAGGFGVFLLLAATALAVARQFWCDRRDEAVGARLVAPAVAAVALVVMVLLAATDYGTILDVAPGSAEAWQWPASFLGWYL